jgi:beta-barrel assembly-enhancing protease
MKNQATGIFYDGNSSVPQEVVFLFDSNTATLVFEASNGTIYQWKCSEIVFEKTGYKLSFRHKVEVSQNGYTTDSKFIDEVLTFTKKKGQYGWYQSLLDLGTTIHLGLAVVILAIIGLCYLYAIPWVAEKSVVLIPEEYDTKLGDTFFEQNVIFSSIDSSKTKALNEFAKELKLNNTKQLKFSVVDSEIVNAFALPDGNIVVYTGILDSMQNYDELVGLLGHEAAHVNHRHSMKMLCRNLSGYLFVSAILGDVNGIMATIGNNINSLQSLSFSREFEHQADVEGFNVLVINKINPIGMANLFKRLENKNYISMPQFLSSHPMTEDRITFMEKRIKTKKFQIEDNEKLKNLFQKMKK